MSEVTITVRGEHEVRVQPERATVHVTVRAEGPSRADVLDAAGRAAEPLRKSLDERMDAETIVDWSSTRLSVRSERPWNPEGKRLAPVFHASIDITATFTEAAELSTWVSDAAEADAVEIGHVDWHLTAHTRAAVERDVATEAVRVAVERAEAYAAALGRKDVAPVSIADQGLLHRTESAQPRMFARAASADMLGGNGPTMQFHPEEIVVSATIEAQFLAR